MFTIIDAIEKPITNRQGVSLYPWGELQVGKGFFVPDHSDKPMRGSQLAQTGNQWAVRHKLDARFQSFRYTLDGVEGVQVNRVA